MSESMERILARLNEVWQRPRHYERVAPTEATPGWETDAYGVSVIVHDFEREALEAFPQMYAMLRGGAAEIIDNLRGDVFIDRGELRCGECYGRGPSVETIPHTPDCAEDRANAWLAKWEGQITITPDTTTTEDTHGTPGK